MQPRVTAILVARNGSEFLEHTLASLKSQTRPPDSVVFVDSGSSDSTAAILAADRPTHLVLEEVKNSFGVAVAHGVRALPPAESEDDWLWILGQDSAPHPRALATLLHAVEIAPSVAIAGPKLMRWDRPDTIAEYGETLTNLGTSVALVENELDQAQHDVSSDLLGVAADGMLVRRSVWEHLGGFDPALPSIDASLDFSLRARLAGHRVVGVPSARILSAGGPELFGRATISSSSRALLRRSAQLHRRLTYSRRWVLPLHWLSLLPLALLRSLGHLAGKHPGSVPAEFRAALAVMFSRKVGHARNNLARTRTLGWAAIAPLRITTAQAREMRAQRRETVMGATTVPDRARVGFFSGGGAWAVLVAAVIGIVAFGPFVGAASVSGGGLAPLGDNLGAIWSQVGYGWHQAAGGFVGAADPFTAVVALLASATFFAPSLSVVLLYLIAVPAAAYGAWWCAVRFSERSWPPAIAALLWALAPPFLSSLTEGHLGAVIAHLLLPWIVLLVLLSARSWSAAAGSALVFAVIVAASPILAPALVVALLAWMIARPRRIPRLIGVFIPAAALFAPLVVDQIARGLWLGWLAEPGVPAAHAVASGWQLAIGAPTAAVNGWRDIGDVLGFADVAGPVLAAALLVPFAAVAFLSLFLHGSRRAMPAFVLALLGYVTAVGATLLQISFVGSEPVAVWAGAGLSLYWLGLVGAAVMALEALGKAVVGPALIVALASTLAVGPLLAAPLSGSASVQASTTTSTLPAFVAAEAASDPLLGTLELTPQADGSLSATLHRGTGTSLEEYSTLASTATELSPAQEDIATVAGNLASRSGLDIVAELDRLHIGFVLLSDAPAESSESETPAASIYQRAAGALDAASELTPVGDTTRGLLWHYQEVSDAGIETGPGPTETPWGIAILIGQGFIFFVTLMLAIPTSRGRGRSTVLDSKETAPGFDEEDPNV
ncbi:MAG TPA: glycosyltransferase family 2 protein [Glaciihabitans sp.]|nr:glycosyltransferase family 2 protein [Glaciihabitans sp.]